MRPCLALGSPSGLLLARCVLGGCLVLILLFGLDLGADTPPPLANPGPFSPKEELSKFQVSKGFRVELPAREPEVVDPVCMAFDERGRLFVAEMIGYPNAGVGTGSMSSGRIRVLEDRDGEAFTKPAPSTPRVYVSRWVCSLTRAGCCLPSLPT